MNFKNNIYFLNIQEHVGPYPFIIKQDNGKQVPVVQAYAYTKYLGHLNLTFDDNGKLLEFQGQPILLDGSKRQGICKNISIKVKNV